MVDVNCQCLRFSRCYLTVSSCFFTSYGAVVSLVDGLPGAWLSRGLNGTYSWKDLALFDCIILQSITREILK